MATTENLRDVTTNLSPAELREVVKAIDSGEAKQVPGTGSVFAGSSGAEFDYKGSRYEIAESFEKLTHVLLVRPEQRDLPIGKFRKRNPFPVLSSMLKEIAG